MAARLATALCHGAFFGIGSIVAAELVPPAKRGQAIAVMFSGLTLANVLGVSAGTALGQYAGWRAAFWCVVAIALAATAAITWLLLLFGVGTTIGNLVGGRRGDWRLIPSIAGAQVGLIATLAAFTLTLSVAVLAAITLLIWGMLTFTTAAPLQMRVVDTAPEAPHWARA